MTENFKKGFTPFRNFKDKIIPEKNRDVKFLTGFTLAETLIVIAVFGIVTAAVYEGYSLSHRAYKAGETDAEIIQNGRVILERLSREARQAREIVGGLPEEEAMATTTLLFEDGHIAESYHYIHYFLDQNSLNREVLGYYFSGDLDKNLMPWNAAPPVGQTLETEILEAPVVIGEYISEIKFWGSELIDISVDLEKQTKNINFRTKVHGRNF